MSRWIYDAGRGLGVTAGVLNSAAWAFAMWVPMEDLTLSGVDLVVAFVMCLASIVAVLAAARGHAAVLLGAFLVSFLPIGAFALTLDHWLKFIGFSDLVLLASAVLIRFAPRAPAAGAAERHG